MTIGSLRAGSSYNIPISEAELAIAKNNYRAALEYYNKAFVSNTNLFAVDLYNASICAVKCGQNQLALEYCTLLARKGVGDKFFIQSIYASLRGNQHWKALLEQGRKSKAEIEKKHGDLICLLDSLVAKDQWVNHVWRAAGMSAETRKIMDLTYDTIQIHLKRIIDSTGFICEDMIGAPVKNDTILERMQIFDIIIIHNYTARMTGDTLFNGVLRQALAQEKIKPEYYASLRDFTGDSPDDYFGTSHLYMQYKCTMYREKMDQQSIEQIETNRRRIGLPPLSDYVEKLLYNLGHRDSIFNIYGPISKIGSFKNESSEKIFMERQEVVVESIADCQ